MRRNWRDDAVCLGMDQEIFFPFHGDGNAEIIEICESCPVKAECLEAALVLEHGRARNARFGIWGGKTPTEREALGRRRRRPKP